MQPGSIFEQITSLYETVCDSIIRPKRDIYDEECLGSPVFSLNEDEEYNRTDFFVRNSAGEKLVGSHFEPAPRFRAAEKMTAVVYTHGNASSRLEALQLIEYLLPMQFTLVCFDFSGCGLSEGEYVTLGYKEADDLDCIIKYILEERNVHRVALWGRSMGAYTALKYASTNPSIFCVVADSAFFSLEKLALDLSADYMQMSLPTFLVKSVLYFIRRSIIARTGMDIYSMHLRNAVLTHPTMLIYGSDDTFVSYEHSHAIYAAYKGKTIHMLELQGDHNSARSFGAVFRVCQFLAEQRAMLECGDNYEEILNELFTKEGCSVRPNLVYRSANIATETPYHSKLDLLLQPKT